MVKLYSLDHVFSALADPTRRAILLRLARGEATVMELAEPFAAQMSLPAVSKHLRILEHAGMVERQKIGRVNWVRLRPNAMQEAAQWLVECRSFWEEQFDSLSQYLEQSADEAADDDPQP